MFTLVVTKKGLLAAVCLSGVSRWCPKEGVMGVLQTRVGSSNGYSGETFQGAKRQMWLIDVAGSDLQETGKANLPMLNSDRFFWNSSSLLQNNYLRPSHTWPLPRS